MGFWQEAGPRPSGMQSTGAQAVGQALGRACIRSPRGPVRAHAPLNDHIGEGRDEEVIK